MIVVAMGIISMQKFDVAIIGGGLIGLATAYRIQENHPNLKIVVLEKESKVGRHQSGSNSGVIHSGIYYKPGSLKAKNCRAGKSDLEKFCEEHHINFKILGKLIIACDESELPTLNELYRRGQANGVQCSLVDQDFIKTSEPHVAGIKGIYVPEAGIVDYKQVSEKLRSIIVSKGVSVHLGSQLLSSKRSKGEVTLITNKNEIIAKYVINCAGLYSDKVATILGFRPELKIIPFRGEYYDLKKDYHHLCKTLIYPVPNMNFPFLGVHFTRRIGGGVECGPNAVLAFAREGYKKSDIKILEFLENITYPGFIKLSIKYWSEGWNEIKRSFSKTLFTKALKRLIPEIEENYLIPGGSGVRAQAVRNDGSIIDDFVISQDGNVINVLNAPSPGATSCLNIGLYINELLTERINDKK